ncbi:hypothetical protein F2P81_012995 [Scophthalmus maximus]|uniref:Uncharacterized protein n=1 Tax=Scophthalmus maximus TaxID=52904 RepID=A0A6A4SPP9_SCOMX|nr:hypothetical protein F2P81_012995 [Scophthalmus maximus]
MKGHAAAAANAGQVRWSCLLNMSRGKMKFRFATPLERNANFWHTHKRTNRWIPPDMQMCRGKRLQDGQLASRRERDVTEDTESTVTTCGSVDWLHFYGLVTESVRRVLSTVAWVVFLRRRQSRHGLFLEIPELAAQNQAAINLRGTRAGCRGGCVEAVGLMGNRAAPLSEAVFVASRKNETKSSLLRVIVRFQRRGECGGEVGRRTRLGGARSTRGTCVRHIDSNELGVDYTEGIWLCGYYRFAEVDYLRLKGEVGKRHLSLSTADFMRSAAAFSIAPRLVADGRLLMMNAKAKPLHNETQRVVSLS